MSESSNFVFVTYTESPGNASKKTRDLVRKQALKAFHSPRGSNLTAERERESNAVKKDTGRTHMGRFRLPKAKSQDVAASESGPRIGQRIHVLDPFISSLGSHAWDLLNYFRYSFRMKSMSVHDNQEWFTLAMYNTSISQATLCLVSLNKDLESGITVSSVTLHHKASATKLLQQEIDAGNANKELIAGTVALLAISEDLEGNRSNSTAHLNGMLKLVNLCGGLKSFSKNKAILKLIAWADLCHAATWLSEPALPSLFSLTPEVPWPNHETRLRDPVFRSQLEEILCPHLRSLIDTLNSFPICPPTDYCPPHARRQVSQLIYIVEQLAIDLRRRIPFEGYITSLARAFVCAAQLYILVMLRQLPLRSHSVLLLTNDLVFEMEMYGIQAKDGEGDSTWNVVVLWIQVVGLLSLEDHDADEKLGESLRRTLRIVGVSSKKELVEHLQCIAWSEGLADEMLGKCEIVKNLEGR